MSTRKGMDLPTTCSVTLGSARVMARVIGLFESGPLQLSRSLRSSSTAGGKVCILSYPTHPDNKVQETVKWAEIWEGFCVLFTNVWNSYYLQ